MREPEGWVDVAGLGLGLQGGLAHTTAVLSGMDKDKIEVLDKSVYEADQLRHDRDQTELGGFAVSAKALIKCREGWIVSRSATTTIYMTWRTCDQPPLTWRDALPLQIIAETKVVCNWHDYRPKLQKGIPTCYDIAVFFLLQKLSRIRHRRNVLKIRTRHGTRVLIQG